MRGLMPENSGCVRLTGAAGYSLFDVSLSFPRRLAAYAFLLVVISSWLIVISDVNPVFAQERGIGLLPANHPRYSEFYNHSYALVVGIDSYPSVPKLRYATNDARSFTSLLESQFGFDAKNVTTLLDSGATRKNIMLAFDRLRRNAQKDDRVLVFFAGHGETIQMPDGRQKGYILPYDVDTQDLITTAISTDQLNEISQLMPAKHLFYIMDACYGGLIFSRAAPLSPSATDYLEVLSSRSARKALTAGGQDQTVQDNGPGGHSVFTYYLVTGLQSGAADLNGDGMITSAELDSYIAPRVTAETNRAQTPEYGILGGDTGGDFVFIPDNTAPADLAQVTFGSDPSGATLSIDGKPAGATPITLPLSPSKHLITITKPGFVTRSDSVVVAMSGLNNFSYSLNAVQIPVTLDVNVDSAQVFVDAKQVAQIPGQTGRIMIPVGTHTIELRKDKYASASSTIDFIEGGKYNLPFVLDRAFTTLAVNVDPDSAAIYIDGSLRLLSSGSVDVKIGAHEITVEKEGYETYERQLIAEGSKGSVRIDLAPIVERLRLSTNPSGAVITVDEMPNALTPATLELGYGRHEIKIEKPHYKPVAMNENVATSMSTSKSVDLVLSTQGVAGEIIRMRSSSITSLRWSNVTLTALSGIAAIVLASRASAMYQSYMNAKELYEINGTWDRYRFYSTARNFAIGATALFGLATVYSIFRGVDRSAAYREASDLDAHGVTFSSFDGVDDYFNSIGPVIADLSTGLGRTPLPGGMLSMDLQPFGLTMNLPLGGGTSLRIGGAYYQVIPEVDKTAQGLRVGDPITYRADLAGMNFGLGITIAKVRLSGDYIFLFDPKQQPLNPLMPSSLIDVSVEGEIIPSIYAGLSVTAFQSKRLWGIEYEPYTDSPIYYISPSGVLVYPNLVMGIEL